MSKRLPEDAATDKSQKKVHFEPTSIGPISTLEEMDVQVLRFQNKKLAEVRICFLLRYHPTILAALGFNVTFIISMFLS